VYWFTVMILFALASLMLLIVLAMLSRIIVKHFKENLNRERNRLLFCQIIFGASFFLRAILISTVMSDKWYEFSQDYPQEMTNTAKTAMVPLQFFLYNVVPFTTLVYVHH